MKVSFDWLKEYYGETDLTAEQAAELLGMHAFELEGIETVGDDTVIDVDILPNRSSDALSHRGVARELATLTNQQLANDPLAESPELPETDLISVAIADKERCPRFTASLITGIEIKESPDWLKQRLEAIGQRPINNIVDATNYVMFAVGQPLHAYDAELFPQVDGKWQFEVRQAKEGEVVSLLAEGGKDEDRDVELKGTETLVVDGSSNTPIGLAGVKGGRFAGIHDGTTKVIIEAANWHPTITRQTARPLGIITDAGKRFENEITRETAMYAQAEIVKLITDIAGGESQGVIDTYLERVENLAVPVSVGRTNTVLGLSLDQATMEDILFRVGCAVTSADGELTVTGPWERTDLQIEEDFIEEIGRVHGYEHVSAVLPTNARVPELNKRHFYSEKIREILIGEGFSEVITSSFRNKDKVQLKNALASDKTCLRSSLSKNISETLDKNAGFADLLGATDTRVFEIGTVFYPEDDGIGEHISLTLGIRIKQSGYTGKEDEVLKQAIATLETGLDTTVNISSEKGVAEVNLTELFDSLPDPEDYTPVTVGEEIAYQPFSVHQHMSRDIAMWVKEGTTSAAVEAVLNEHADDLRVRTTQFDEFTKDGRTSLGFRLVFQSDEKTLTDEEVNEVMERVYKAVEKEGWEVR